MNHFSNEIQNENISNNAQQNNKNNNYYDEDTKSIIVENSNLFIEIDNLKKDINIYKTKLEELNNNYNKLKKDYQNNYRKNVLFENIKKEKDVEDEFNRLEEEKYKIKLKHCLDVNDLMKEKNNKFMKHNEYLKKYYKIYTGKDWNNSK